MIKYINIGLINIWRLQIFAVIRNMSRLDRLIQNSENALNDKTSFVNKFKYPGLFISSLKELRELVGNEQIKESFASQIMYLVSMRDTNKNVNAQPVMMNTLLYGPPGTGKTSIGVKIAKIWYAMGIINGGKSSNYISTATSSTNPELLIYGVIVIYLVLSWALSKLKEYFDIKTIILMFIILTIIIVVTYYFYQNRNVKNINNSEVKDSDLITIVSREDFIGQYLGWTETKTKELLLRNTGKVLFIDEAYSLCSGERDMYGNEALTTLNRYLSEHADKIVVIMAGYKNLIENTLLKSQPGLKSRFMWHFECKGYTPEELYHIFLITLDKEGWAIVENHKPSLQNLITQNISYFGAFGRDMQRLLFFSQLEYAESYTADSHINPRELSIEMIERGMKVFIQNNLDSTSTEESTTDNVTKDLLQKILENPDKLLSKSSNKTQSHPGPNTYSPLSENSSQQLESSIKETNEDQLYYNMLDPKSRVNINSNDSFRDDF